MQQATTHSSGAETADAPDAATDGSREAVTNGDRVSFRVSQKVRSAIEEIKAGFGYTTDAEVMRHAIGTHLRMAEAMRDGEKVYVGKPDDKYLRELVFIGQ